MREKFTLEAGGDWFSIYEYKGEIVFGIYQDFGRLSENVDVKSYLTMEQAIALRDGLSEAITRLDQEPNDDDI